MPTSGLRRARLVGRDLELASPLRSSTQLRRAAERQPSLDADELADDRDLARAPRDASRATVNAVIRGCANVDRASSVLGRRAL